MKTLKAMRNRIKKLLRENLSDADNFEYQVRDVGGPVYYKRKKGDDVWSFINEDEFLKNSDTKNTIKFVDKIPKKDPYVRQIDVPQEMDDRLDYLKIYYTNISPNDFDVSIKDKTIIIKT
jgi:hypothetical protein